MTRVLVAWRARESEKVAATDARIALPLTAEPRRLRRVNG